MAANSPRRIATNVRSEACASALPRICFLERWAVYALLCAVLVPSAFSQPSHPNGLPRAQRHEYRHEIEQLEEQWRTAMLKGNSAALETLLADDYTGITAKGAIQTKSQAVAYLKSGEIQLTALEISDRKVRVYGTTSVVTSVAELTGGKSDPDVTGRYRYTRVYVRNPQGLWKIVSFEASRIQEPSDHK
jgi:ketosteroid isomerase-like protein